MVRDFRDRAQETASTSQQFMRSLSHSLRRKQDFPMWALVAVVLLIMLFWNWQLVMATMAGVMVMSLIYILQDWEWHGLLPRLQKLWRSPYRRLSLAVATGASTVFFTYTLLGIWSSVPDHWLASAEILQLTATFAVLLLLAQQVIDRWVQKQQTSIDQLISRITSTDDLERLIAVRQLAQCVQQKRFPLSQERAIADYCHLLLSRESVPAIRDAALETIESLNYLNLPSSSVRNLSS
ncbi:hypothetical protein V2H45_02600 [Tumidithrix elongata RA019]|uniref:Uncharacterized protein n=1 Tax=Tumidithrix elongata BACA0141 TaxID=2716417 RepID=A0AAW9PWJ3_9CYAN|nr:hypothetical protein [Tumidithrix elongata RA019]